MSKTASPVATGGELKVIRLPGKDEDENFEKDVDRFAPWIVRGTIFGVGVVGIVLFTKRLRIFAQFRNAAEIPNDFIKRSLQLRGIVDFVQNDYILRVKHIPIYKLPKILQPRKTDLGLLNIRLAAIDISDAGHTWLFRNLQGKPISFALIKRHGRDCVDCEVFTKKRKWVPFYFSVNRELVRRGLARVPAWGETEDHNNALQTVPAYARLVNKLLISESWASKREVGMWRASETWAERFTAFPSQAYDMMRNTGSYRLASITGQATGETGSKAIAAASRYGKIAAERLKRLNQLIQDWWAGKI